MAGRRAVIRATNLVRVALYLAALYPAKATTISGTIDVDDVFTAYLSTNPNVLGTQVATGNNCNVCNYNKRLPHQ